MTGTSIDPGSWIQKCHDHKHILNVKMSLLIRIVFETLILKVTFLYLFKVLAVENAVS